MIEQFDISIVIATYNRSQLLAGAIECVLAQKAEGVRYELIVVDNNSTDTTREVVNSFASHDAPVRYVVGKRQGISYARNAGITQSRAQIVAFTDDDIRVASDWLVTMKNV